MGTTSKGTSSSGESAAKRQSQIASQVFGETAGLRIGAINTLEDLLGYPLTQFSPVKNLYGAGVVPGPFAGMLQSSVPGAPSSMSGMPPALSMLGNSKSPLGGAVGSMLPGAQPQSLAAAAAPVSMSAAPAIRGTFNPAREAIEAQFAAAREQLLSSNPAQGGQLNTLLSGLGTDRARSVAGLEAQLISNAWNQALGLATGAPPVAMQGLGAASQQLTNISQLQFQNALQLGQAIGGGVGGMASKGATGGMGMPGKGASFGGPAVASSGGGFVNFPS